MFRAVRAAFLGVSRARGAALIGGVCGLGAFSVSDDERRRSTSNVRSVLVGVVAAAAQSGTVLCEVSFYFFRLIYAKIRLVWVVLAQADEVSMPPRPSRPMACPGDFEDMDQQRSLEIHPSSGITIGVIKMLQRKSKHPGFSSPEAPNVAYSREPAMLQASINLQSPKDPYPLVYLDDSAAFPVRCP
jgi:hypothetical protein